MRLPIASKCSSGTIFRPRYCNKLHSQPVSAADEGFRDQETVPSGPATPLFGGQKNGGSMTAAKKLSQERFPTR